MMTSVNIAGFNVSLSPMDEGCLKGVSVDTFVRYNFYEADFNGSKFCVLESKDVAGVHSPGKCRSLAEKLQRWMGIPIVFLLNGVPFVIRQRLINQGVYFVVPGKYANLPTLFVNAKESHAKVKKNGKLSPVSQYILLSYLQRPECTFDSIAAIQKVTPFSYLQISRAVADLERFNLCEACTVMGRGKEIRFSSNRKELWETAKPSLRNPIVRRHFTDVEPPTHLGPISGMNALSHYTNLNPVKQQTFAVAKTVLKETDVQALALNPVEGKFAIEEWMYPPTIPAETGYVDPLSLWLTLTDNDNPRIEDAVEQLIESIKW
jgi:hypothetical protein